MINKRLFTLFLLGFALTLLVACNGTDSNQSSANEESNPPTSMPANNSDHQDMDNHEDSEVPHWSYEGEGGPDHWAELDNAYEACGAGLEQSPIDLTGSSAADLVNITFNYAESDVNILNNGHTIQVNYDEGSSIEIEGHTYNLVQFHFHAPSEHAIDGSLYPIEMHLVHADANGNLAVVGVFVTQGAENTAFTAVWDNLPAEETDAVATGMMVNAAELLPADQLFYRYNGSLTTPPCSEGVLWSVMAAPIEMSAEQIAAFTTIFDGNNRPLQPLNDRDLQLDETP
ncbi:MAG: carbonic anhydrase family protein [Ardenticatenaceae bacterium]|nr:carbonic anhydrase family protein [Ardenticatenaceae bacterium]